MTIADPYLRPLESERRRLWAECRLKGLAKDTPERLRIEDGRILNPDGGSSPIVHQSERIKPLAAHVQDKWGVPSGPGLRERRKTLRTRVRTLGLSVLRRLPEWR